MSKAADNTTSIHIPGRPEGLFGGPEDVLRDETLSNEQKREVLARWASDAHAVENAPALRQLDNGAVVGLDEILCALKALDARDDSMSAPNRFWMSRGRGRRTIRPRLRVMRSHRDDNDDDPPPPPAMAAYPVSIRLADALAA